MQGPNDILGVYTFPPGAKTTDPRIVIDGVHGKITTYLLTQSGGLISAVLNPEFSSKTQFTVSGAVIQNLSDGFRAPANDAVSVIAQPDATGYKIKAYGTGTEASPAQNIAISVSANATNIPTVRVMPAAAGNSFVWMAEALIQIASTGAGGSFNASLAVFTRDIIAGTTLYSMNTATGIGYDTTVAQVLGLAGQWDSSGATITSDGATFQRIGP